MTFVAFVVGILVFGDTIKYTYDISNGRDPRRNI
jgi:hypothetical protein